MTYEGPGMMTRSEVKRSVKEGKGKLATPICVVKSKSNRMSVGGKEEEKRGEKNDQGRGEKHTASHEVRNLLLNLDDIKKTVKLTGNALGDFESGS